MKCQKQKPGKTSGQTDSRASGLLTSGSNLLFIPLCAGAAREQESRQHRLVALMESSASACDRRLPAVWGTDIWWGRISRALSSACRWAARESQLDADGLMGSTASWPRGLMEKGAGGQQYFVEPDPRTLSPFSPRMRLPPAARFRCRLGPSAVAVADFNNDQKQDLVVAGYSRSFVYLLLGNGQGSFGALRQFQAGRGSDDEVSGGPLSIVVGDFNGDLKP